MMQHHWTLFGDAFWTLVTHGLLPVYRCDRPDFNNDTKLEEK
jgi:hypothetical protein